MLQKVTSCMKPYKGIFYSRDVQFNEQVKHQSEGVQIKSDYQLIADFSEAPEADMGGDDVTQLNISRNHLLQNQEDQ